VKITIQFHDCLPVVFNSLKATKIARYAAQRVIGENLVISQGRPSLGGEDFAFYQQVVEGCLVRFGADSLAANGPAHSGSFDFDENVLGIGAAWLACVAIEWLEWLDENGEQKGNSG
jgi:hippurate hydrolase